MYSISTNKQQQRYKVKVRQCCCFGDFKHKRPSKGLKSLATHTNDPFQREQRRNALIKTNCKKQTRTGELRLTMGQARYASASLRVTYLIGQLLIEILPLFWTHDACWTSFSSGSIQEESGFPFVFRHFLFITKPILAGNNHCFAHTNCWFCLSIWCFSFISYSVNLLCDRVASYRSIEIILYSNYC